MPLGDHEPVMCCCGRPYTDHGAVASGTFICPGFRAAPIARPCPSCAAKDAEIERLRGVLQKTRRGVKHASDLLSHGNDGYFVSADLLRLWRNIAEALRAAGEKGPTPPPAG